MGCFEDLMQFKDEVDWAEKKILIRGRSDKRQGQHSLNKETVERLLCYETEAPLQAAQGLDQHALISTSTRSQYGMPKGAEKSQWF